MRGYVFDALAIDPDLAVVAVRIPVSGKSAHFPSAYACARKRTAVFAAAHLIPAGTRSRSTGKSAGRARILRARRHRLGFSALESDVQHRPLRRLIDLARPWRWS